MSAHMNFGATGAEATENMRRVGKHVRENAQAFGALDAPADVEPEAYVDEVPRVGTFVVRDGDIYQEDALSRLLDVVAADIRRGVASPQLWSAHVAWTETGR